MRPSSGQLARWLLVLAALGVIAFLALRSSPEMRELRWIPRPLAVWADAHGVARNVVAFFGLGIIVFLALSRTRRTVVLLCIFGTGLEVAQLWIPGRQFDWQDIGATLLGIFLAWPLAWAIARLWPSQRC